MPRRLRLRPRPALCHILLWQHGAQRRPKATPSICDGARFAPPCACASRKQVEPASAERALRGDRRFSWPQGAWLLGERGRLGTAPSRPSPPGGHAPCGHEKRRSPRSARSALAGSTCLRDAQAHGGAKRAPSQIEASVSRVATHRVATPDMRSLPQIGRSRSQPPAPSAAGAVRDQQGPRRDRVRHRRGCARAHARARTRARGSARLARRARVERRATSLLVPHRARLVVGMCRTRIGSVSCYRLLFSLTRYRAGLCARARAPN